MHDHPYTQYAPDEVTGLRGHLARVHDVEFGSEHTWQGMTRFHQAMHGLEPARDPDAREIPEDVEVVALAIGYELQAQARAGRTIIDDEDWYVDGAPLIAAAKRAVAELDAHREDAGYVLVAPGDEMPTVTDGLSALRWARTAHEDHVERPEMSAAVQQHAIVELLAIVADELHEIRRAQWQVRA